MFNDSCCCTKHFCHSPSFHLNKLPSKSNANEQWQRIRKESCLISRLNVESCSKHKSSNEYAPHLCSQNITSSFIFSRERCNRIAALVYNSPRSDSSTRNTPSNRGMNCKVKNNLIDLACITASRAHHIEGYYPC